ncbi:MAG: hypothetical protein Q9162_005452 [Coniocarpon cinnabarinum]
MEATPDHWRFLKDAIHLRQRREQQRQPQYENFFFPPSPSIASEIVRVPATESSEFISALGGDVPRERARRAQEYRRSSGARWYHCKLRNPMQFSREDRDRIKDERFYESAQMLLTQDINGSLHSYTISKESVFSLTSCSIEGLPFLTMVSRLEQAEQDRANDEKPSGHHPEYRDLVFHRVMLELLVRAKDGILAKDDLSTWRVKMTQWRDSNTGLTPTELDQVLLMASTTPSMMRRIHFKSLAPVLDTVKRQMGHLTVEDPRSAMTLDRQRLPDSLRVKVARSAELQAEQRERAEQWKDGKSKKGLVRLQLALAACSHAEERPLPFEARLERVVQRSQEIGLQLEDLQSLPWSMQMESADFYSRPVLPRLRDARQRFRLVVNDYDDVESPVPDVKENVSLSHMA